MTQHLHDTLQTNGNRITGLPTPSAPTDAATKQWVEQNAGGSPQASNVTFTAPEGFPTTPNNPADNVQEAINNLFTYANSGKSAIAGAIGTPTTSANKFTEMATAINDEKADIAAFINSAEGSAQSTDPLATLAGKLSDVRVFKTQTKLRKQANTFNNITLNNKNITQDQLCINVNYLKNDGSTTEFSSSFNNGDSGNFIFDSAKVEFTGTMQLKLGNDFLTNTSPVNNIRDYTFDLSQYSDFKVTALSTGRIDFQTVPLPQVVRASGPIDISDVSSIESIALTDTETGNGKMRLAISADGGNTYKAWTGSLSTGSWVTVFNTATPNNVATFATSGMTEAVAESLTYVEFEQLIGTSTDLRFAYYLERPTFADNVNIDAIQLNGRAKGSWETVMNDGASKVRVSLRGEPGTRFIEILINEEDTYQINWIDKP